MKCRKCGIELSDTVCRIHERLCTIGEATLIKVNEVPQERNVTPIEEIKTESNKIPLNELLQMCIDNQDIKYSPSTIRRWKEERAIKELGL